MKAPGRYPNINNNEAWLEIKFNREHQNENKAQGSLGGTGAPEKMSLSMIFLISDSSLNAVGFLSFTKYLGSLLLTKA